jgi:hypothetical protein
LANASRSGAHKRATDVRGRLTSHSQPVKGTQEDAHRKERKVPKGKKWDSGGSREPINPPSGPRWGHCPPLPRIHIRPPQPSRPFSASFCLRIVGGGVFVPGGGNGPFPIQFRTTTGGQKDQPEAGNGVASSDWRAINGRKEGNGINGGGGIAKSQQPMATEGTPGRELFVCWEKHRWNSF